MAEAFVVSAVRTPVGKVPNGTLRYTRPDETAAVAMKEALARVPALNPDDIDDVILGCAKPEVEQGLDVDVDFETRPVSNPGDLKVELHQFDFLP